MATSDARLHVRLAPDQKALVERAAAYTGTNLSAFTVATLVERARDIVATHELTVLSDRDRDTFLALLDAPPAPTEALRAAARRHQELLGA